MKTLIIYHSEHHRNTEKIARAMAEKTGADITRAEDVNPEDLNTYDMIGFGSGVYNGKLHSDLSEIIMNLPQNQDKKVFIFSTTGSKTYSSMAHSRFKTELEEKEFKIMGEFSCLGFDTALTDEGINRGRPDTRDIKDAEDFIADIIKKSG